MPAALAPAPLSSFRARMAARPRKPSWPFDRKFKQWLSDNDLSIAGASRRLGVPYATFHGWVKGGVRVPADGMAKIALFTRIPASYWTNDEIPYPPPVEYMNLEERAMEAMKSLTTDQLAEILEVLQDPEDLRRTLALRRAAKS